MKYLEDSLQILYPFPVISSSYLTCLYLYNAAWYHSNALSDFSTWLLDGIPLMYWGSSGSQIKWEKPVWSLELPHFISDVNMRLIYWFCSHSSHNWEGLFFPNESVMTWEHLGYLIYEICTQDRFLMPRKNGTAKNWLIAGTLPYSFVITYVRLSVNA